MESNTGKPMSEPSSPIDTTLSTLGSHDVTLNPVLSGLLENPKNLVESISTEYHLTARITNRSLSVRDLSLLLDVLNYQIVRFGANFSMILACTELFLRLSAGKNPNEINDGRIRKTLLVSQIILQHFQGSDYSLYQGDFVHLSSELKKFLSPYLMSKRTYSSRHMTWRPEKFIRVSAVPVNTLFERGSQRTERYSGYTKGYGESHGNAHRKKTKPSMELDGDAKWPDKEERNLILRMTDSIHQEANILWIKFRNLFQED